MTESEQNNKKNSSILEEGIIPSRSELENMLVNGNKSVKSKSDESKSDESKSDESKFDESKFDESKFDESKSDLVVEEKGIDVKKLQDDLILALENSEKKASEHWDMLLRTKAEVDNIKRRSENDVANARKFAVESLLKELIPVIDSFDQGVISMESVDSKVKEGILLAISNLSVVLKKVGVEIIDNLEDKKFDPSFHEAVSMQVSEKTPPNHIVSMIQKGYTLHGRIVRAARVIVSKG